jgi:hypothetical protein
MRQIVHGRPSDHGSQVAREAPQSIKRQSGFLQVKESSRFLKKAAQKIFMKLGRWQ